eukprot:TRINITY_DN11111_c0_g1_i3.p5 TRINITY_DN11111_c0_g1~~TRINITY_DN11111_c0_g1_i3.p5  ORF type:complete len:104 (-),score=3.01 TRINITY_DN11111_c0_g1_i3:366-677(-)
MSHAHAARGDLELAGPHETCFKENIQHRAIVSHMRVDAGIQQLDIREQPRDVLDETQPAQGAYFSTVFRAASMSLRDVQSVLKFAFTSFSSADSAFTSFTACL